MPVSRGRRRKAWAIAGTADFVVFGGWALLAFRANGEARAAMHGDGEVAATLADDARRFAPATTAAAARNRHKLPASASRVVIGDGNHARFGDHGVQSGDRFARITRTEQRTGTATILLDTLARVAATDN